MWSKLESHEQNNKGLVIPFQFIDPRKMKIYVNEKDLYKKIWKNPYVQKLEQIHMCINRKTDQLIKWSCGDKKKKEQMTYKNARLSMHLTKEYTLHGFLA